MSVMKARYIFKGERKVVLWKITAAAQIEEEMKEQMRQKQQMETKKGPIGTHRNLPP